MCTVCTCSPAACRPPVRAAGTSGHHTLSPSLHCGRPPPCPPRDCLRPPDAPPHLKDRGRRLTNYTKLGQCLSSTLQRCQCPASCFRWTLTGSGTFSSSCTCIRAAGDPCILHVVTVVLLPLAMRTLIQGQFVSGALHSIKQDRTRTLSKVGPGPGLGHAPAHTESHSSVLSSAI